MTWTLALTALAAVAAAAAIAAFIRPDDAGDLERLARIRTRREEAPR